MWVNGFFGKETVLVFDNQHAAMGVVGDAVGGVAQQPAPQLGMVAVADDNEIVSAFVGMLDDGLGGVAGTFGSPDTMRCRREGTALG